MSSRPRHRHVRRGAQATGQVFDAEPHARARRTRSAAFAATSLKPRAPTADDTGDPPPSPPGRSPSMFPTRTTAFLAACLGMLLTAPSALAASSSESTPLDLPSVDQSHAAAGGGGGGLVRTFVGLAIVLAVIYGLYWVLKQVKASKESSASGQGLESVATIPLGPNRALHLVRAGRELVLLGVAEQTVVPIRSYREDEARALGLLDAPETFDADAPTAPPSPGAALRDVLGRLQQKTVRS